MVNDVKESELAFVVFRRAYNADPQKWLALLSSAFDNGSKQLQAQIVFQCSNGYCSVDAVMVTIADGQIVLTGNSRIPLDSVVNIFIVGSSNAKHTQQDKPTTIIMLVFLAIVFFALLALFLSSIT